MKMRERGAIGPRHDCREFGVHMHVNGSARCRRCGHSYDMVHTENEVCVWCKGIDEIEEKNAESVPVLPENGPA
jgi:hypothetical protein